MNLSRLPLVSFFCLVLLVHLFTIITYSHKNNYMLNPMSSGKLVSMWVVLRLNRKDKRDFNGQSRERGCSRYREQYMQIHRSIQRCGLGREKCGLWEIIKKC